MTTPPRPVCKNQLNLFSTRTKTNSFTKLGAAWTRVYFTAGFDGQLEAERFELECTGASQTDHLNNIFNSRLPVSITEYVACSAPKALGRNIRVRMHYCATRAIAIEDDNIRYGEAYEHCEFVDSANYFHFPEVRIDDKGGLEPDPSSNPMENVATYVSFIGNNFLNDPSRPDQVRKAHRLRWQCDAAVWPPLSSFAIFLFVCSISRCGCTLAQLGIPRSSRARSTQTLL